MLCDNNVSDNIISILKYKNNVTASLNISAFTKEESKNNKKNSIKVNLLEIIGKEPIHIDKIIGSVNIDRIALFELLFEMQNENEIICLPGNYYVKIS